MPAAPSTPSLDLTGTWRGSITVNNVAALMTWTLTQTNAAVNGTVLVALPTGTVLMNGSLSGTLSGTTLTYTITVPAQGIPAQPACSGEIRGTTVVAGTSSMNGTFTVASSTCATGLPGGTIALTKQ